MFYSWSFSIRDIFSAFLLYQVRFNYIDKTAHNLENLKDEENKDNGLIVLESSNKLEKVKKHWKNGLKNLEGTIKECQEKFKQVDYQTENPNAGEEY
jgi:hypothetical protein